MRFQVDCADGKARCGQLETAHGTIETPVFMPVGTRAAVKTLTPRQLQELGPRVILGNTYHLMLRPGMEVIEAAGGLHSLMRWDRALLTDSGGYQVFLSPTSTRCATMGWSFAPIWMAVATS